MRRLDELLTEATERGDRMGPSRLIEHLERRLDGERELVVAADRKGGAMVSTDQRPITENQPRPWWMRPIVGLAAFAVAAVAVAAVIFAIGGGEDAADWDPIDVVQTFAKHMRDGDIEAIEAMWTGPMDSNRDFLEWNIALEVKPEFTDCTVTSQAGGKTTVVCTVVDHEDAFYSQLMGPQETTAAGVVSIDGTFVGTAWPAPEGILEAEREFREWIRLAHPELEDRMFGNDYAGIIRMSREAGELKMQYLDEYLTYLGR